MNDKLTNLYISTNYREKQFYFMRSDFLGSFAYWVVSQSPYDTPDISKALAAFGEYVGEKVKDGVPEKFSYNQLHEFVSDTVFEKIPDIEKLNHRKNGKDGIGFTSRFDHPHPDDDFIDLSALARNVTFMMMREQITQS